MTRGCLQVIIFPLFSYTNWSNVQYACKFSSPYVHVLLNVVWIFSLLLMYFRPALLNNYDVRKLRLFFNHEIHHMEDDKLFLPKFRFITWSNDFVLSDWLRSIQKTTKTKTNKKTPQNLKSTFRRVLAG